MAFKCYLDWSDEKYTLPKHPYHFKCIPHNCPFRETHWRTLYGKSLDCILCLYNAKKSTRFLRLMMNFLLKNMAFFKQLKKTFPQRPWLGLLSYLSECLAHEEVLPGITKSSGDLCRSTSSFPILILCLTPCIFPSPQPSCFLHFLKLLYIYSRGSLPCNKRIGKISLKLYQKEKDGVELEIPAIYTQ